MSDFLTFLNTADVETLTRTPGITRSLAEGLISGRPYEAAEECLEVYGMGPNLLVRLQSTFEAGENTETDATPLIVPEEAKPAPVAESRPQVELPPAAEGPSFWSRMESAFLNVFRAVVRFVAFLIVIGGVVALIYFGVPYLRDNFIAPMERNTTQISSLNAELAALRNKNADLQAQVDALGGRLDVLEQTAAAHSASLEKLAEVQASLEASVKAGDETLMMEMRREITLTRAIEYLSRARLYLSQSNFGLAREDVQAARDLLGELQVSYPDFKAEAVKQAIERLDLAAGNLPAFPVVAVGDVDIALQMLLDGLPDEVAVSPATPTPVMEATPTPVVDFTPTPTTLP